MVEKTQVYLLSVHHWLTGLTLASWIYLVPGREVFFVDPAKGNEEVWALSRMNERMPVMVYDFTGDESFGRMLAEEKRLSVNKQHFDCFPQKLSSHFGLPQGLVTAFRACPGKCVQGAILAVRLGFGFLPEDAWDDDLDLAGWGETPFPVIFFGAPEEVHHGKLKEYTPLYIEDEAKCYRYLAEHDLSPNYLLIINSTDLKDMVADNSSLSEMWVKGLSSLGMILASYRDVFVFDMADEKPNSREVERKANELVRQLGFKPKFQAALGAPGAIPFIMEKNREIAGSGEEPLRDIHIQLNHDLFFDVAEGRLFQSTPGGLSLQLLSTKYYHSIRPDQAKEVLIVAAPYVETGIIFDSDQALIDGKLKPLLEDAGHKVTLLTQKEASVHQVAAALPATDFFLYSGHGGPKSLNTHQRFLAREYLPDLPPLVAYASACSTMSVRPDWLSVTEGLDWEEIQIPPQEVIGLALVERGAVCFIGGVTNEDFQFTNAAYSIFFESLLLKGMSVGQALNETRNFVSLYGAVLSQKAPEAYGVSKEGIANIIHQQILLGDPALVPCPNVLGKSDLIKNISRKDQEYEVSWEISPDSWKKVMVPIGDKAPTKAYYRTGWMEHDVPLIPDIISWGDFYHLAIDSQGMSEKSLMSGYLHLYLDLEAFQAPEKLELVRVEGRGECLLCRREMKNTMDSIDAIDVTEHWQSFIIPYQMLPPISFDMTTGWPFVIEDRGDTSRLHWLVPVMVIDEKTRRAYMGEKMIFRLKTIEGNYLSGKVVNCAGDAGRSLLVTTGDSLVQAICDWRGEFRILCGANNSFVTVEEQFPLFDLLAKYAPIERACQQIEGDLGLEIKLKKAKESTFHGRILDIITGEPVSSALIRVWRGKLDPCGYYLREGWVAETIADQAGSFSLPLKAGAYLIYIAAKQGDCRYKSKEMAITLGEEEERYEVYSLERAGVVKGTITFAGGFPPGPTVSLKKYPLKEQGETLSSVPVRNNGTYECLVGFQDRFCIIIEKEGWQGVRDTNLNQGYKLAPEEILQKDYFIEAKDYSE